MGIVDSSRCCFSVCGDGLEVVDSSRCCCSVCEDGLGVVILWVLSLRLRYCSPDDSISNPFWWGWLGSLMILRAVLPHRAL